MDENHEIRKTLGLLTESKLNYAIIDGWTSLKRTGSDVDILIDRQGYKKAIKILEKNGYKLKSIKPNINLFFSEVYADKKRLRFHLTTGLMFGKPLRFVWVPLKKNILKNKVLQNNLFYMHKRYKWIKIVKEFAEVPHNILRFIIKTI